MEQHIAYQTIHHPTGRQYLGIHSTGRLDDGYLGSGADIKKALREGRRGEFTRHVIREFPSREAAERWERFAVTEREVADPRFMNRQTGGGCGRRAGAATRERQRRSATGRPKTAAELEKLRVANTGKKMSPDAIERSASKRRGTRHTPEARARMSAAAKGRKPPAAALAASSVPVIVSDRVYVSVSAAARGEGVSGTEMGRWVNTGRNGAARLDKGDPRVLLARLDAQRRIAP